MKSSPFAVGNINLKGRKTVRLGCGCCTAQNFKENHLKQQHEKEMRKALVAQLAEATDSNPV